MNEKVYVSNPMENKELDQSRIVDGVIVRSAKPEKAEKFGSIMVQSENLSLLGFASKQIRIAFIPGEIATLKEAVVKYNLTPGAELVGYKIIIVETLSPQFNGHLPKINPETKDVITHNGQPIYRDYKLTSSTDTREDIMLENDKVIVETQISEKENLDIQAALAAANQKLGSE